MTATTDAYEAATLIKKVEIDGFKNLTSQDQPDFAIAFTNPTFIIGPNGSGKSNLGEALQFVKNIINESHQEGAIARAARKHHGGTQSICRHGNLEPKISMSITATPIKYGTSPEYHFEIAFPDSQQNPIVETEELVGNDFVEHGEPIAGIDIYNFKEIFKNDLSIINKLNIKSFQDEHRVFYSFSSFMFYNSNNFCIDNIKRTLPQLDPDTKYLSEDGTNLSNIFLYLENSHLYKEKREIESFIKKNIDPSFETIRTPMSSPNIVGFKYHRETDDTPFTLNTLSDGTIRMLMWAAVLLHPEPPPLIFIDEPELGLHPEWMGPLMEMIWKAAEKTQVIVATHSPDLLDQLDMEDAGHVLVCERDENGLAMFNALDPEPLSEWLDYYRLGEMFRLGRPEIGGWSDSDS